MEFDSDGVFAFLIVWLTPFAWTIGGTLGGVAILAAMMGYIALRLPQLGAIITPRLFIVVIPAFAMLSVLWSQAPMETMKYSLEFGITVWVGLLLSAAPDPKAVLWGVFSAFALYVLVALAFGHQVGVGDYGETAFSGLTNGKNTMADIAATGALASLACLAVSIEERRRFRALLVFAAIIVESYLVIQARSAGALLGIVPAVLCFIFFAGLRPARLATRLAATLFACLSAGVFMLLDGKTLLEDGMTMFDKDPTLTGRTYLWQRAADLIAEKPALGTGYSAFWVRGNPDAEGMWQYGGIASRQGFNFHNTLIETLVNLGWLGVFVLGIVTLIGTLLLLHRAVTRPTLATCFWLSILVYNFMRMPIEATGTAPFAYSTVLIFAAIGFSLGPWQGAVARAPVERMRHFHRTRPLATRSSVAG